MRIAVLGAGITGLTAAVELRGRGHEVAVFEAGPQAGGAIRSVRTGGWLHESGPNSILAGGGAPVWELVRKAGLEERVLRAPAAARRRFIVRQGAPAEVPGSPLALMRGGFFSAGAKARLLAEPCRHRADPSHDETVGDFVRRRLGQEFLDYAVEPLVGGVYAGDPDRLSVRSAFPRLAALERRYGSLILGALRRGSREAGPGGEMISFPEGLQELPAGLAACLGATLRLGAAVTGLREGGGGGRWSVESVRDGKRTEEYFAAVVCALPAPTLATLAVRMPLAESRPFAMFGPTELPPVVSVFTGFRREDVAHPLNGFGLLAPRCEGRRILGTLFSSTLFPGRAPAGHVALTTFLGGVRQPEAAEWSDVTAVRVVRGELQELLGVRGGPVFVSVIRHAHAIPQYVVGYGERLAACAVAEAQHPGLFAGGNARDGISVAACVASGRRLAEAANSFVRTGRN